MKRLLSASLILLFVVPSMFADDIIDKEKFRTASGINWEFNDPDDPLLDRISVSVHVDRFNTDWDTLVIEIDHEYCVEKILIDRIPLARIYSQPKIDVSAYPVHQITVRLISGEGDDEVEHDSASWDHYYPNGWVGPGGIW